MFNSAIIPSCCIIVLRLAVRISATVDISIADAICNMVESSNTTLFV